MDASERGNLLNRLADLLERDHAYLAVSALKSRGTCEYVCVPPWVETWTQLIYMCGKKMGYSIHNDSHSTKKLRPINTLL